MKPQYVKMIVSIAEHGSIGGAAQKLGKSQPAFTKSLRLAEEELGTKIFHRVPHGVVPTVTGLGVIERCKKIDRDIQILSSEISQMEGNHIGTISLIVSPVASAILIPDVIKRYQQKYPNIRIATMTGHEPGAFQALRRGEVAFVVGVTPEVNSANGLQSVPLSQSRIIVVTGVNSKFVGKTHPEELKNARWLTIGPPDRRPRYSDFFESYGIVPPVPVMSAESIVTILSLVEGSDHVCCIPDSLFDELKGNRKIGILPFGDEMGNITVSVTSAKDRIYTPAEIAFLDVVKQYAELESPHNKK